MGIWYRSIFSALFEKKKRITEFVSCFIGSLVVKVIKYRFVAPREGCYQDLLVIMVNRLMKIAKS